MSCVVIFVSPINAKVGITEQQLVLQPSSPPLLEQVERQQQVLVELQLLARQFPLELLELEQVLAVSLLPEQELPLQVTQREQLGLALAASQQLARVQLA